MWYLSQPGHVMFCSRSQVKHLMARLPVTSCCTTNTTSHNRILHNLGHCSLSIFHFVSLLSISVSSISSFSVCSHCHKKILNTESSLILDNSIVYLVTCFTQYSSVYCASWSLCLFRIFNFCVVLIVLLYSVVWCRLTQCSGWVSPVTACPALVCSTHCTLGDGPPWEWWRTARRETLPPLLPLRFSTVH